MPITFIDEQPKAAGITFLDEDAPAGDSTFEAKPAGEWDAETLAFVDELKSGRAELDFQKMDQDTVLGVMGTLSSVDEDLARQYLPEARGRAKELLQERGALLFEPGGEPVTEEVPNITYTYEMGMPIPVQRGTRERIIHDPDGLNRSVANFLGFAGATGAAPLTDFQGWVAKNVVGRDDKEAFEEQFNRINALSKDNRALYRFAYGDSSRAFEGMGTLLGWVAGANALYRGGLGKAIFTEGPKGLERAPWYKFVKNPVTPAMKLNPVSVKGLAAGAAYDVGVGAALGPEYVPSWLADLTGMEQSRVASAIEAGGIGLIFGTAMRGLTQQATLRQLRKHPEFAGFEGSDKEFVKHVRQRMQEWDEALRQPKQAEPVRDPDPAPVERTITSGERGREPAPAAIEPTGKPPAATRFETKMAQAEAEATARKAEPAAPIELPAEEARTIAPELRSVPEPPPESTAELIVDSPVYQVPREAIVARPDVMQFKRTDDAETGVNAEDKLEGKWDDRKAGLLLLWKPKNPELYGLKEGEEYIVANGHHRYEFGIRNDRKGFNAQIIREEDGFSPEEARAYAAEINIADGKGSIYDQAKFFRNAAATHGTDEALARARQTGARGRKAATIGLQASDPVFTAFINEKIDPDRAAAITAAAPGDEALQVSVLDAVLKRNLTAQQVGHYAAALKSQQGERMTQSGLFGDEEMIDAERLATRAASFDKALTGRLRSVTGAAKRPELAKSLGVDVNDKAGLEAKIEQIRALREQFSPERWYLDERAKAAIGWTEDPDEWIARELAGEEAPAEDPNQAAMFEPEGGYNIDAIRRLRALRSTAERRPLMPEEHAEIERLEREVGQDFFDWLDDVKSQEQAIGSQRDRERQQMELKARQEQRLQADDYLEQNELFGASGDQLALFEEFSQYLSHRGIPQTSDQAQGIWQAVVQQSARHKRAARENQDQLLFDFSGRLELESANRAPGGGGEWLRIKETVFNHELITEGKFTHIGAKIESPEDLAIIARNTLRNPRFETFYVIPIKAGRALMPYAVTSRVPYAAVIFAEGDNFSTIRRYLANAEADGYYLLHNHPSGRTVASTADIRTTKRFASEMTFPFLGHVIINHDTWTFLNGMVRPGAYEYTITEAPRIFNSAMRDDPLRNPASSIIDWKIEGPSDVVSMGKRLENPDNLGTLFFKDRQGKVNAVGSIDLEDLFRDDFDRVMHDESLRNGAEAPVLYLNKDDFRFQIPIRQKFSHRIFFDVVFDVPGKDVVSLVEAGEVQLVSSQRYIGRNFVGERVMEEGSAYGRKEPLLWSDDQGKLRAGPDLGLMEKVRVIDLPEIVQLARDLTGSLPQLKNLPSSRGLFKPAGKGMVVLNKSVFTDPMQAAKTLAHEIGHLTDYLPDRTLARGNMLGRIATLRNFLSTSLPKFEDQGMDTVLTPKDRGALRRRAERETGPRPPKDDEAGLGMWRDAVSRRYQELVEEEMEARNLVGVQKVREELLALSADWRGDWEGASESYRKYRESSEELYADALSVLINDPAYLKQRAPQFWELFFEYIGRKPEVEQTLHELYDFLARGELAVLRERQAKLRGGFQRGEDILLAKARERKLQRMSPRGLADRMMQDFYDVAWPMLRRAAEAEKTGARMKWDEDPRNLWSAHPLSENRTYRWLDRLHKRIIEPLREAGIGLEDLGEYLFANRVMNETFEEGAGRGKIANPFGIQPPQARKQLLNLRLQMGIERMTLLEAGVQDFQKMFYELAKELTELGFISRNNFETIIEPNKDNYATFAAVDHLADSPHIPAGLRKQSGMLKETANPFTAMVMKAITMMRAAEMQRMKLNTVQFLQEYFPDDFEPARTITFEGGRRQVMDPPSGSDKKLLTYFKDGKQAGIYTDPYIADVFEYSDPSEMNPLFKVLNWTFREGVYKLWVQYSPAFLFWTNPARDFKRTWQNLPMQFGKAPAGVEGVARQVGRIPAARLAGAYKRSWADAVSRVKGEMSPIVREMMDNHAFGTPFDVWTRSAGTEKREDYFLEILRKYHLAPEEEKESIWNNKLLSWLPGFFSGMNYYGNVIESLSRISAYRILRDDLGWAPPQAARHVREHIGTPPFWRRGRYTVQANSVLPFFNVAQKGYATDLKLMTDPKTRSGWWWRWARGDGKWAVLKAAAKLGLLGEALRRTYEAVGSYDMTNYNVVPLGEIEDGEFGRKTAILRIPMDETSRLLSGVLYQTLLTTGKKFMEEEPGARSSYLDVSGYAADQLPGLNPLIGISRTWGEYVTGQNPRNYFRGGHILTNDQWLAGGAAGVKPMIAWTLQETGVTNFVRYDPEAGTSLEYTVNMTPILNRAIRFTDQGLRSAQMESEMAEDRVGAQLRVKMDPNVRQLLQDHGRLRSLGEGDRSAAQEERYQLLKQWHSKVYWPIYSEMRQRVIDGEQDAVPFLLEELRLESESWED